VPSDDAQARPSPGAPAEAAPAPAPAPAPDMPALFLGHGSPMNAIEDNRASRTWRALGAAPPRPRAILAVSAHWYTGGSAITAMVAPRTIHDFGSVPPEPYAIDYPAPGNPEVAAEAAEAVRPTVGAFDTDSWGSAPGGADSESARAGTATS